MTRLLSRTALVALVAWAVSGALAQDAPRYRVRDLNALTGLDDISVSSLNNRGDVTFVDNNSLHGFLWRGGQLHDLGAWGGGTLALNERGEVAGTRRLDDGTSVPFLWRNGHSINPVASLGAGSGMAHDINESGQIVGEADRRAFLYDGRRARYLSLDTPGLISFGVTAINDAGVMAGDVHRTIDDVLLLRAYLLRQGTVQVLPDPLDLSVGGVNEVTALNNAGNVVVFWQDGGGIGSGSALYIGGRYFDLGNGHFAHDLNDHDWAAGHSAVLVDEDRFEYAAFLFHDGRQDRLDQLMTPGSDARWDKLEFANAINDRGQIVGGGTLADGSGRAFIATPVPEASGVAMMLAGLGVLGALMRGRRRDARMPGRGARPAARPWARRVLPRLAAGALAACAVSGALAQEPPRYRLRDLNALTGLEDISVLALNNRGDFTLVDRASERGYLWRGGRLHDLGAYGGGTLELNERGEVAGTRQLEDGRYMPFLWRDGRSTDLFDALGPRGGWAYALNERGQAVGMVDDRAFLFDGRRTRYLDIPGASTSAAQDINDGGLIVGRAVFAGDAIDERAFTLRNGRVEKLPEPIPMAWGGQYEAVAVNNAGNALVDYWDYNWGEFGSAMYVNGTIFDLGYSNHANDINEHDWASGVSVVEVNWDEFERTALLIRNGQTYNLNRLLTPGSDARWGWLESATSINDRGQLLGSGLLADGRSHAFIATPVPEASGVAMMLAGLGVLGAVRGVRRRDGAASGQGMLPAAGA